MAEKVYGTRSGFKVMATILAVLAIVTIVLSPFGLLMLWIAYRGQVRITDDKLVIRWMGTREIPWGDIAGISRVRAAGFVGGLMRPITYQLRSKPNAAPRIALGAYEGSDEILAEITRRTGHTLAA